MLKRYGVYGSIRLVLSVIFTKIFFPKARLIRLPFDLRNKKYINLGHKLTTGFGCRIEAYPLNKNAECCITFGNNVEINDYVHIASALNVEIGNDVLIASKVYISDINHGKYRGENQDSPYSKPNDRSLSAEKITICDNVWIGESCCILPGVSIGKGSIIGALSVVTKDIPEYSIAVGAPAKVIKKYDFDTQSWMLI